MTTKRAKIVSFEEKQPSSGDLALQAFLKNCEKRCSTEQDEVVKSDVVLSKVLEEVGYEYSPENLELNTFKQYIEGLEFRRIKVAFLLENHERSEGEGVSPV